VEVEADSDRQNPSFLCPFGIYAFSSCDLKLITRRILFFF